MRALPADAPLWLACALALAAAAALRLVSHTDGDVSWLLYAAERTLAGAVPYRDFLEVNPPASILIYVPAVLLAHGTGLRPEAATDLLVFLAAGCSLALSGSILGRAGLLAGMRAPILLGGSLVVLLVLPLGSFAQREHIAALALLPCLAALAARVSGHAPPGAAALLAGIGAGIAITIKPVFGLALAGPWLSLASTRSWRDAMATPELWVACALAGLYGLGVEILAPDYARRVMPAVLAVYLPARLPLPAMLGGPVVWMWVGLTASHCLLGSKGDKVGLVLLLASAGFEACYFAQGKGFPYHGLPAVELAALGCVQALSGPARRKGPSLSLLILSLAPAMGALALAAPAFGRYYVIEDLAPGLEGAIAAVSPHPRLLTISDKMSMGRVFAREVGGEWAGSTPLPWITLFAGMITPHPERDPRFAAAIEGERDLFAKDIVAARPDVVLIDERWLAWTRGGALGAALSCYVDIGPYGGFHLLDHAVARSNRSSDRAMIDSNNREQDVVRKPVPTFRHLALGAGMDPECAPPGGAPRDLAAPTPIPAAGDTP